MSDDELSRANCVLTGSVQAVGFRWWAAGKADALGLAGHAVNQHDGSVEVVVQGPRSAVDTFVGLLREQPSRSRRPGRVASVDVSYDIVDRSLTRFRTL